MLVDPSEGELHRLQHLDRVLMENVDRLGDAVLGFAIELSVVLPACQGEEQQGTNDRAHENRPKRP